MASSCPHIIPKNYLSSLQGKLIYKDQCCKCFHDPRDPEGLDLCLKCLAGSCQANSHNQLHFENTQHPIALNVKLIKKENPQENAHELTKLAIGKAGGASLNQPEYDEIYQLKCLACKIDLDNNLLSGIINSVKQENSAFKKQDIVEWELEINPCEHTLTLEQVPKSVSQGLSHCHECDLSANLWLCLVCGNVGCGRKNYDGSGGNGHAAQHSKQAHHCLVVKLGTITAEGNASIFCYDCDNDVSDGQLAEHLRTFDIKIADQKKTEKTMAELNLDANRALTLSSILEEGKVLHPLFGVGNTGMQNIGNSCYMNSVFQVLFSLKEFKERYSGAVAEEHLKTCNKFSVECLTCQLSKLGVGLQNGQYSKPEEVKIYGEDGKLEVLPEIQRYQQQGVAINDLRTLIGKNHVEFKTKQMQDALEYLQFFFDTLEKEEKVSQPGKKSILDVFQFKTQNKLTCTKCFGIKLVNGTTRQLDLPIPRPTTEQLLEIENQKKQEQDNNGNDSKPSTVKSQWEDPEYATTFEKSLELLQSTDSMELNCPRCAQKTIFTSNNYLQTLPEYLIMPTKRLILENWVPKKLNAVISLPENIDLTSICAQPTLPTEFILQDNGNDSEEQEQPVDQTQLFQLLELGFSENRSKRALLLNNNNAEAAMNYLFEHAEDNSLDLPLEKKPAKSGKTGKFQINEDSLGMLESMGFDGVQSRLALKKYANNLEIALDALSNGEYFIDEDVPADEPSKMEEEIQPIVSANYELYAAIVHLGKSVHAGHYISYVRRDGKWIYLNDAKVAVSDEPSLGKGYIYVLKRK